MKRFIILVAALFLTACENVGLTDEKKQFICKAAIATLNGFDPKGDSYKDRANIYALEYTRDDGKHFKYHCKFEGRNIRWRDNNMSGWNTNLKLSYEIKGNKLIIKTDILGETDKRQFTLQ